MNAPKPSCDGAIRKLMKSPKDDQPWADDDNADTTSQGGGHTAPRQKGWRPSGSPDPLNEWSRRMYWWGRKVRRDILVLEHHLKNLKGANLPNTEFYGDPGDPPPPLE